MKRLYKLTSCFQYTHSMDSFKEADSYSGQMVFDCKNAGKAPKSQAMALSMTQLPAEIDFANRCSFYSQENCSRISDYLN